jgi:hypothetical protein
MPDVISILELYRKLDLACDETDGEAEGEYTARCGSLKERYDVVVLVHCLLYSQGRVTEKPDGKTPIGNLVCLFR